MSRDKDWSPTLRQAIQAAISSGVTLRHLSLSAGLVHSEVHRLASGERAGSLLSAQKIAAALERLAADGRRQTKACSDASKALRRALKGVKP